MWHVVNLQIRCTIAPIGRRPIGHDKCFPFAGAIVGISISIIVILFFGQHFGTHRISFLFSPIIILWLLANFSIGIYNLSHYGASVFNVRPHLSIGMGGGLMRDAWLSIKQAICCQRLLPLSNAFLTYALHLPPPPHTTGLEPSLDRPMVL